MLLRETRCSSLDAVYCDGCDGPFDFLNRGFELLRLTCIGDTLERSWGLEKRQKILGWSYN